ncbi:MULTISPECIES: EamA family transporter RarD [Gulbenkiania]|uniref:RarD protein n=2 Tax=Gulbenkiania TaxID=397456 RepID=A0A0K6GXH4_9NEIS|nr:MULTISPECIES: EamA family transporter RarD [Gulbenkiania]TCW32992.1 chloramphenicol-sensitive protein RarD [Gulbenkiania mobilis]CUA83275.1 rarD protein [Gulbenkiania indica]
MSSPSSSASSTSETGRGVLYAVGAYFCWGLFPLYWKPLASVSALQILCHRIVWSAVFVALILLVRQHWAWLRPALQSPRRVGLFMASSLMLSANWLIYIWAVNDGRVVEASLGYFINPLVNVLLGRLFLGERLTRPQALAVLLAGLGVMWLTVRVGAVPWVALGLAASFGIYGLLRKKAPLASLEGLALETFLMLPVALAALGWFAVQGQGAFGHQGALTDGLLIGGGIVTAIPLLMFAAGARRLKLATMGLIQYIGPTMQLMLGVLLYHEPFDVARLVGFALIWSALLLYSGAGVMQVLGRRRAAGAA